MGEVYEAIGPRGKVALKLVTHTADAEVRREGFLSEAESLRVLSHPAIVPVVDLGVDPATGTPYLVMDVLEGEDLGARIERDGALPEHLVVAFGLDLAAGLAHAHELRIVHRAIKPANVLLPRQARARGRAMLCDFALSKWVEERTSLTATGALTGTPHYMSPEQFLDAKRVDERSDVFSLAMTLLHALTGRNPLAHCTTTTSLMMALCTRPIPRAEDVLADAGLPGILSPTLSEALRRALATDPLERASLGELRRDLAACEASALSLPAPRTRPAGSFGNDPPRTATRRPPSTSPRLRRSIAPRSLPAATAPSGEPATTVRLTLGAYRTTTPLGVEVFAGTDEEGRAVRLERLRGLLSSKEGERALAGEVSALGTVLSESVVALLDHGRAGDDAWLVTEPLTGPTLGEHVKQSGPLPYVRAVSAFVTLARGLGSLHDAGLVHGHLVPESFHFRSSGKKRLLVLHDLGVAKRIEGALRTVSRRGAGKKDLRADIVQVVSALYFAALGKVPFGARLALAAEPKDPAHPTFAAPDPVGRTALDDLVRRTLEGRIATLFELADELATLAERASGL
jgi:serine/threonine protein kinase